jgi:hypothetical protein
MGHEPAGSGGRMSVARVTLAPKPEQSVCPTCGKLLETSHLVQLNRTLELLLSAEGVNCATVEALMGVIVVQIELVSRTLCTSTRVLTPPPDAAE